MNNRRLMERVVLEVGLDLGVIPGSVFTMPVFVAVLSTAITGPSIEGVGTTRGVPLPDGDRAGRRTLCAAPRDDAGAPPSIVGTDLIDARTDPYIAGTLPIEGSRLGIEGSSRWSKRASRAGEG